MKARLVIAALAAALPACALSAEEIGAKHPGRDAAAAPGFRAELLGGFDTDGYNDGVVYGGRVGYDFKAGRRFLLGIEGEVNGLTTDDALQSPFPPLSTGNGPEAYVGGRATFILSSRFRLFGGGGYSRTKQGNFVLLDPDPAPLGTLGTIRRSYDGFRLSAGGQFLLGRRAFIGAEYRFSDYEGFAVSREQVVGSIGFRF
ncbi:MAG TPA: outer membrane beta-barrel protein [Allosphingosinicella sp.]|nr:outer membrane beta-barrel protein [Allosphingosinicella sp.]